ncbi:hypothetical protein ACIPSA_45560 [Streptomyces sp. NPDC086549]|uniref:hypothetical protein n=1 Tax=Streptomyces sp. NPDC086549 TaxID=3365752 RepID=UPI00382F5BE6
MSTALGVLGQRPDEPYDENHDLEQIRTWRQRTSGADTAPTGQQPADNNQEGLRP